MELRIALAQVAPRLGEVDANLELATRSCARDAARGRAAHALSGAGAHRLPAPATSSRRWRWPHRRPAPGIGLSREAPGMLVAIGFVEETDDHRFCNSAALLRDGELHRPAPQGLPADVRPVRRGALHVGRAIGSGRIAWGSRSAGSGYQHLRGLLASPACRCSRRWTAPSLLVNLAAGPARAPGSAAGLRGDRRLAQDAGHLCAARHGGGRVLQPGRQRGGAHLLGRLAAASGRTARPSSRRRSTRRRS